MHAQAHKLLFWFEIEQYKLLAGDDRVRTWANYFRPAKGGLDMKKGGGGGRGGRAEGVSGGVFARERRVVFPLTGACLVICGQSGGGGGRTHV